MLAPRRPAVLLASGALALAPPAPALAHGAGDSHDGDQLAQSESGGRGRTPPLSDKPHRPGQRPRSQGSGSDADRTKPPPRRGSGRSGPSSETPVTTATQLPYTGADARVIGLLGLALVLLGIGLRLRTADVRR